MTGACIIVKIVDMVRYGQVPIICWGLRNNIRIVF